MKPGEMQESDSEARKPFWAVSSMTYSGMGETPKPRAGKRVPRGIGFPADVSRVGRP